MNDHGSDGWRCATCGESHAGLPLSFAADFPDMYANMKREERDARAVIGSDPKGVFTTETRRHREKQKLSPRIDADQRGFWKRQKQCRSVRSRETVGREELVVSYCCDAMSRAIIKSGFASAAETAEVLGVSRAHTQKLIQMAERALSSNRRSKAKNGARKIASRARKRS